MRRGLAFPWSPRKNSIKINVMNVDVNVSYEDGALISNSCAVSLEAMLS
jgi:hypothetical protein